MPVLTDIWHRSLWCSDMTHGDLGERASAGPPPGRPPTTVYGTAIARGTAARVGATSGSSDFAHRDLVSSHGPYRHHSWCDQHGGGRSERSRRLLVGRHRG